ncbi:hypothetical protein FH972_012284 [Carpinus fangiana]|uniref:Legume lectin domain-containing protein n=1 Tax=Carpinus fangiana TaxID=176857 RepID=A0A5N6R6G5_9ROSI|nr:hypothetical protein FH972_012284 [Carpinus fangiana]
MSRSFIFFLLLAIFSCSFVSSTSDNFSSESLDASLQAFAFKTLVRHRPHTGALYKAILPDNLSSIDVSIVRLRSRRLWNRGANFSFFHIPSRTMPVPHVRRLAIVYQNLGNLSSQFYRLKGYSLITPVVGFLVFDASNVRSKSIRKLSLNTMGKPISIHFPSFALSDTRCVAFNGNGTVYLSEMGVPAAGVCYCRDEGHFSVVVPVKRKLVGLWYLWVSGFVLGISGLAVAGYAGMVGVRILKTKKIQVMERQADEDLILESRWVGCSKMPSAAVTRTQPVLENGGVQ